MALKRDDYKERVKSQFLPKVQERTKSTSLAAGLEPVLWRILAGKKHLLVSLACVLLTFAAITARVPPVSCSRLALWFGSQVSHGAAATCSNSCCFRSVITRVFGFCLVWTEEKVADAAADSRQVWRSEIGWQPPAPPTSEASSCIWMRWHTRLRATGCSGGCGRRISDAPAPRQCPIAAWCRRQALPCAPSGAATQEHRVLLMFEPESWGGLTMTMSEHAGDSAQR